MAENEEKKNPSSAKSGEFCYKRNIPLFEFFYLYLGYSSECI
jgi:hypothetical protein